ncbi:FAD binding domain protein [Apiospora sp. TS-2023a]
MIFSQRHGFLAAGLAALMAELAAGAATPSSTSCRVLPGDADWPTPQDWQDLNKTVGGRLIESVPRESVCHDAPYNRYDAEACAELQKTFDFPKLARMEIPGEFMDMSIKNYSCDAFAPRSAPCGLGNHASYVIDVSEEADTAVKSVQAALDFVRRHNIRLVIKNTGHDYLGRSTGTGALSLWTHHLKSTEFIPAYNSSHYKGPALKMGAGVQGFEAYAAANATGHRIVGGSCPTVGISGGYSQSGGHSILASRHGLGSDNVLEWEVVTVSDGQHVIATPDNEHADLYWALSGGGPGNYAIVLSMTARIHRDAGLISGGTLGFNDSAVGNAAFWDAVGAFQALIPGFAEGGSSGGGNSIVYGLTASTFNAWTVTIPDTTPEDADSLMKPLLDELTRRGIDYEYSPHISRNFLEHFDRALGPLPEGVIENSGFMASRMIPRAVLVDPASNARVTEALRNISELPDYSIACQSISVGHQPHPDNAVLPAWRDAALICLPKGSWDPRAPASDNARRQIEAVTEVQNVMDIATGPAGGVYMNEVSYLLPDWRDAMYGANYDRLLAVKRKYDPESVLYVLDGVGSDGWAQAADKRLCRVAS